LIHIMPEGSYPRAGLNIIRGHQIIDFLFWFPIVPAFCWRVYRDFRRDCLVYGGFCTVFSVRLIFRRYTKYIPFLGLWAGYLPFRFRFGLNEIESTGVIYKNLYE